MGLQMSSDVIAIRADRLGKVFAVYDRPLDRLCQLLAGNRRQYGRRFSALSDISFTVPKGKVLGLVGDNGAGKSTLLQLICKTLTPTTGTLEVKGRVAALLELGAGFNPEFSGRENVYLNAAVLGLTRAEIEARYEGIVEFSGVRDFIEQPVKTYSSGMYMRLAFSIATCVDPDILVIDEALSVGDGAFARKSFDRIMALRAKGTTILFCSHSMYHIEAICDQAIWMERGHIKMRGEPAEVSRAYAAQGMPADSRVAAAEGSAALHEAVFDMATTAATPASTANATTSAKTIKNVATIAATEATEATAVGPGQARLLAIDASADGVHSKVLSLKAGTSSLKVDVTFQSDPELPPPSVAFGLETLAGYLVSSGSTFFQGVQPHMSPGGAGRVTLEFARLPLMRGKYRLTIFLACERSIHIYDHAQYCVEFDVQQQGLYQGTVFLPHTWNDAPFKITNEGLIS